MDKLILVALVAATIGLLYIFVVKIVRAAGTEYPETVRTPGILGAIATLGSATLAMLYLLDVLSPTLLFQITLLVMLAGILGALAVIGAKL
jgi:hypothetical protein